jgi:ethanolamine ammonia-lyase large subunit
MHTLTPLDAIVVPPVRPAQSYGPFRDLKALLGAADVDKAGDRSAGLAARTESVREAARGALAELTLEHLYAHPLTDDRGQVDRVLRVNYDIDLSQFAKIASLRLGDLKDLLLRTSGHEIAAIGRALTGPMAAALAKLCDVHELILIAARIRKQTRARTLLGANGTLSSRLQPNHPTDDLRGIALLCYWSLSIGGGDALIGVNPAVDTVENVDTLLRHLAAVRERTGAPTQVCVLSHVKTQLACLERGAPIDVMFQSLAGTEDANLREFDLTIEVLDHAYERMRQRGALAGRAQQFFYFETGQGSEFTYGRHHGIDMTTTEALCYGLARRYDPFMVNNVTGFIGPETHANGTEMVLANLQDHFMGKLLGLPMGMAPCFTLHAEMGLESQQIATQLLAAAGANYYMDVALNTDRMLAYFDTSGHDVQTLRELTGRRPAAEFLAWACARGIFVLDADGAVQRGPRWGDPLQFCADQDELDELRAATPCVPGFATAGPRPANAIQRRVLADQAAARDAVHASLRVDELKKRFGMREVHTAAETHAAHLGSPSLGARLTPESAAALLPEPFRVQILVADGLSAEAVHANLDDLLMVLGDGLRAHGITLGQPLIARHGRVKLAEEVARALDAEIVVCLIGERPGGDALASRSLSAYLAYHLRAPEVQALAAAYSRNPGIAFEYTVISNIYSGGLPALEAGALVVERVREILGRGAAGNRLEAMR